MKSTLDEESRPQAWSLPHGMASNVPGGSLTAPMHSIAEMHFHRLRYFVDLIAIAYRQAVQPDPMPRSLRGERIALGIDVPELDTVPLWSVRRDDGGVAVPCVEFMLDQAHRSLEIVCREEEQVVRQHETLVEDCQLTLKRALLTVRSSEGAGASAPQIKDVFLPGGLLDELCMPGGVLEKILRICESALVTEASGVRH